MARGTMRDTRRRCFIRAAASMRMSRRTGCCGRSKAIRKPERCSWGRNAGCARIRTGTWRRRGLNNEGDWRVGVELRCDGCVGAEWFARSGVFVSARQQHAELAESGVQGGTGEVQESAEAVW